MKEPKQYLVVVIAFLVLATGANAQTPAEQFKQLVEQLQKTPNDRELRGRIIKLGTEIKPPLTTPDEALRYEGRARYAFSNAKSVSDYIEAANEYGKAVNVAPWVPGYYSDLCTINEKAGRFETAKDECGLYLIGVNDPEEITKVKLRIAGLEFAIEKAAGAEAKKQADEQKAGAAEEQKKQEYQTRIGWLLGEWSYESAYPGNYGPARGIAQTKQIGNAIEIGRINDYAKPKGDFRAIVGESGNLSWEFRYSDGLGNGCMTGKPLPVAVTVGRDQRTIQFQVDSYSGDACKYNFPFIVTLTRR